MVKIPIKDIYIGENRRKINTAKIPELAESISIVGLLYPVIVQKTSSDQYYLVAGNHRIEAMKYLGFTEIEATVWPEDTNDDLCELAEIDENLQRSGIPWDEEAELHIKRKAIVERMKPNTKAGGDRKSEEFKEKSKPHNADLKTEKCYTQQAAEAVGKSRDTIERAIYIGEHLIPEAKTKLVELGVGKTKAFEIARKSPEEQMTYVKALEEKPETIVIDAKERMDEYSIGRAEKAKADQNNKNQWCTVKMTNYNNWTKTELIAEVKSNPENAKVFTKTANDNYAVKRAEEIKTDPIRQEKVEKTITESLGVRSVAEIGEEGTKS